MTLAYNRYSGRSGAYFRAGQHRPPDPSPRAEAQPQPDPPRPNPSGHRSQSRSSGTSPLSFLNPDFLSSLLPAGIDAGDLLLVVMLFLLYIDTKDEDFLIILIVVGYSMLKGGDS